MKVYRKPHESVQMAYRRLKRLLERGGVFKEMRTHETYVKPSEIRRRKEERRKKLARMKPEDRNNAQTDRQR